MAESPLYVLRGWLNDDRLGQVGPALKYYGVSRTAEICVSMPDENRPKILIVENERIIAGDLERNLMQLGYEAVGLASRTDEAVRLPI